MSFNPTNKNIQCDKKNCARTTYAIMPGGKSNGWVNKLGYDFCRQCVQELDTKYGSNWFEFVSKEDLKNVYY